MKHKITGEYAWCKWMLTNVYNDDDECSIKKVVGTINNVDEYMKAYETLKYRAEYDSMTAIYNMDKFYRECNKMLRRDEYPHYAMISLDIDQLKIINDMYGNLEGDRLIKFIADTKNLDLAGVDTLLNKESGVYGVSGVICSEGRRTFSRASVGCRDEGDRYSSRRLSGTGWRRRAYPAWVRWER